MKVSAEAVFAHLTTEKMACTGQEGPSVSILGSYSDLFLVCQHPMASPALRRLPAKYAVPARMWRHGIHSFLELVRYQLPFSQEYILSFVYLAYQMKRLLMESVPTFHETWTECLGNLARNRMAIEESHIRDRENWSDVARIWYNRAGRPLFNNRSYTRSLGRIGDAECCSSTLLLLQSSH